MEIFGKHIFGTDADAWLKLCKDKKKEWILKHTNQTNETLIDEFIKNPKISKECKCLDCGKNGNISKGISKEVKQINITNTPENSVGTNTKRRRNSKNS